MESDILLLLLDSSLYVHSVHSVHKVDNARPRGRSTHSGVTHLPSALRPRTGRGRTRSPCAKCRLNPLSKCCTICDPGIRHPSLVVPAHDPEETTPLGRQTRAEGSEMNDARGERVKERVRCLIHATKWGVVPGSAPWFRLCKTPLRTIAATAFSTAFPYHHGSVE
jgi:hypothetical protein